MPASHAARRSFLARARLAAVCVAGCCLVLPATGCASFDKALSQRWAVVDFQQGTTVPGMLGARTACSHIRNVVPEDRQTAVRRAKLDGELQYTISNASDAQISLLETCLQRFPSVVGVTLQDTGDGE